MSPSESAAILRQHNEWRRWNGDPFEEAGPPQQDPRQIGEAIDVAVKFLEAACGPFCGDLKSMEAAQ
jgi:hypothetical protein